MAFAAKNRLAIPKPTSANGQQMSQLHLALPSLEWDGILKSKQMNRRRNQAAD